MDTNNFMRQFRDSDSLELKKFSAAQFMEVWEHYDSDGKTALYRNNSFALLCWMGGLLKIVLLSYCVKTIF